MAVVLAIFHRLSAASNEQVGGSGNCASYRNAKDSVKSVNIMSVASG